MAYILSPSPFLAALLIGTSFTNTVTAGSVIIGLLVGIGTLVSIVYGVKYKALAQQALKTIELITADRDAWKDTAEREKAEKKELTELLTAAKVQLQKLEALPNLSRVIDQMAKESIRQDQAAKERQDIAVATLKKMWNTLGDTHESNAIKRAAHLEKAILENRCISERIEQDRFPKGE